jgi:lipoate-protein ligase A
VVLQHGSLLLEDDQGTVRELLREPDRQEDSPPAVLGEFCRPLPSWEALTEALVQGWAEALGARLEPEPLSAEEGERVEAISMRYADPAWTWHR